MSIPNTHQHYKIYKPYGYLSQFINNGQKQKTKKLLGELGDFPEGIMSVGRLDEKSEGLLLLTTDGKVSNEINSSKFEKEYYALVDGIVTEKAIEQLEKGVEIGFEGKKYQTKPCKVSLLNKKPILPERSKKIRDDRHGPTTWISVTLNEGKLGKFVK